MGRLHNNFQYSEKIFLQYRFDLQKIKDMLKSVKEKKMNYHNITHDDMNNGDGLRVVL